MALETINDLKIAGGNKVAHLEKAIPMEDYLELIKDHFIIHGKENNTLTFKIQDGPIKEVGVNGCQVTDMISIAQYIIKKLNDKFPCEENLMTISSLNQALAWQRQRTNNRVQRNVEGTSQQ